MSDRTKQLQQLDRRYIWHPFTQMSEWEAEETIVIERGEGSWLIDTDGNRYLDGVASMWTNVHGHCRRELNEALKAQVDWMKNDTGSYGALINTQPNFKDGQSYTVSTISLEIGRAHV